MTRIDHEAALLRRRLRNQQLTRPTLGTPADVVAWLGAVQAQEFPAARWGVGQRVTGRATDAQVERAFNDGAILRTHMMRPTWHFVAPADIRWIQTATAPRLHGTNGHYYRRAGLDASTLSRSRKAIERALGNGEHLTRQELRAVLLRANVPVEGQQLAYLMMHAELERVICSGPLRGKQFTYALLDARVPPAKPLTREEALAELTRRYFTSHGPATIRDYCWWSGLTVCDARQGIELVKPGLVRQTVGDLAFYSATTPAVRASTLPIAHLLPAYDEYLIAYQDRGLAVKPGGNKSFDTFGHFLVIDGVLAGTWRRTLTNDVATVRVTPLRRLSRADKDAVASAAERYGRFLGLPVVVLTGD